MGAGRSILARCFKALLRRDGAKRAVVKAPAAALSLVPQSAFHLERSLLEKLFHLRNGFICETGRWPRWRI
jgi:hypothetical protein